MLDSIRRSSGPPAPAELPHEVRIRVSGGYEPDTIHAHAGQPLRLRFRREDRLACTEQVVFPTFGRTVVLPPGEDVTVELRPEEPGEYEFTCGMGMLRGTLVVTRRREVEE